MDEGERQDVLPSNFLWMKPSYPIGSPTFLYHGVEMLAFFNKLLSSSRASTASTSSEPPVRNMTPAERQAMEKLTLQMHETARSVLQGRARKFPFPRP
jgi:hypothetical protein